MIALDTGMCAPESLETLMLQQKQLIRGKRSAQMFPVGTVELDMPSGCERYENDRGVYHFHNIPVEMVMDLSSRGRENEILLLGPFSKYDIALRVRDGEKVTYVSEYIGHVELRCAIGSDGTVLDQYRYFEKTREPSGIICVGKQPERVDRWLTERAVSHG
jgi:hypothetical protein